MKRIFSILRQNNCNFIIVISLILFSLVGYTQQTLSGVVVDQLDETPLLGVTVLIESKQIGVVTDFDGGFNIDVEIGDTIQFSYIGYKTIEHVVSDFS